MYWIWWNDAIVSKFKKSCSGHFCKYKHLKRKPSLIGILKTIPLFSAR